MEHIDKLVQLITDRLLEELQTVPVKETVYVLGQDSAVSLLIRSGYSIAKSPDNADYILADSGLSLDAFLRIAALSPADDCETVIVSSLLRGKNVLVSQKCFDAEKYKETAPPLLYRELLQQKTKLKNYGIQFYDEPQLLSLLNGRQRGAFGWQPSAVLSARDRDCQSQSKLITEARVRALGLSDGDTFKLEAGMIVTALAKDYLRRHNIRIEK